MLSLLASLLPVSGQAQNSFDTSGTALLKGSYFIRQVLNANTSSIGQVGEAVSLTGIIAFDGAGNYTLNGQLSDNTMSSGAPQSLSSITGTYAVNASGVLVMDNPLSQGDYIYGGVGTSALVGSSTENSSGFFDFMVAVPMGSNASNSSLSGTYRMVGLEYPNGDVTQVRNSTFLINPDGTGNLGAITVSGHAVNVNNTAFTQAISGATYSLSGTTGTLNFPTASGTPLISGTKQFFVSADGNVLVAGSANGYDIEIGVKVSGSASSTRFNGTYFSAGDDYDASAPSNVGYYYYDTFYGSANAKTSGGSTTVIGHQRVNPDDNSAYDYTYDDQFTIGPDGSSIDQANSSEYFVGAGGTARVVVGQSTYYTVELDVLAQSLPASGPVYINPLGVTNTANYTPITNAVAPGEFLTLFGSGLASSQATASVPFPSTLNGVSVSINGRPAPIYTVSATSITCIVPYATAEAFAVIQVTNNGVTSNTVTMFADASAAGVFTQDQSGTGPGDAVHANGSLVTSGSPAQVGETIAVYLTGLGTVTPAVNDGAAASSNSLSNTDDTIDIFVDGQQANVSFSGLVPGLAGLYQVNFVVPSTPDTGGVALDVADEANGAYNHIATMYVGGGAAAAIAPQKTGVSPRSFRKHPAGKIKSTRTSPAHPRGTLAKPGEHL
jgi:uncharacterized protein (TIGR03437 family)